MEQMIKELLQEMKEMKQDMKEIKPVVKKVDELSDDVKDMKFQLDRMEKRLNGIPSMFEIEAEKRIVLKEDMSFYDNKIIEIEKEIDRLKRA
ncbi:hypothetical protein [Bacillus altitudinis]|uniref:hypothetical protein n=1 Tax=Bacillus altitudinis TaxID=293387 RepID=UPI0021019536|nr:hypothetical protein [Bacillus altitudinis]UTV34856.1 hypothetical protein NM966_19880 [Bacillus altitudinis]